MVEWFNWITFDIIADLLFGEPFGGLQNKATHKYVALLANSLKGFSKFYAMRYFPIIKYAGNWIVDQNIIEQRNEYYQWIVSQCKKRMARETQRPDFMTHILKHNGEGEKQVISDKEIYSNAQLMLTAGTETTATMLSATTYLLLKNPDKMQKLKDEVRGRWKNYGDITLEQVNTAPYLLAVLNEGLRYYPPVPAGFERVVSQEGGEMVSGYYIPKGTSVAVSQYPAFHSERNFKDPDAFVPERWQVDHTSS
jgi:cytochrome P450